MDRNSSCTKIPINFLEPTCSSIYRFPPPFCSKTPWFPFSLSPLHFIPFSTDLTPHCAARTHPSLHSNTLSAHCQIQRLLLTPHLSRPDSSVALDTIWLFPSPSNISFTWTAGPQSFFFLLLLAFFLLLQILLDLLTSNRKNTPGLRALLFPIYSPEVVSSSPMALIIFNR